MLFLQLFCVCILTLSPLHALRFGDLKKALSFTPLKDSKVPQSAQSKAQKILSTFRTKLFTILPLLAASSSASLLPSIVWSEDENITVEKLPYAYEALEPYISEKTMKFHHDKHYSKYVATTKSMVENTPLSKASLEDIIQTSFEKKNQALFNNAAQAWNHVINGLCSTYFNPSLSLSFHLFITDTYLENIGFSCTVYLYHMLFFLSLKSL